MGEERVDRAGRKGGLRCKWGGREVGESRMETLNSRQGGLRRTWGGREVEELRMNTGYSRK